MKTTTAMIPRCLCLLFSVGRPLVAGITDCVLKVWNCVTCNFLSVNSHEHTTWYLKLQPKNDNLAHWTKTSVRHLFNVHYSVTDVLKLLVIRMKVLTNFSSTQQNIHLESRASTSVAFMKHDLYQVSHLSALLNTTFWSSSLHQEGYCSKAGSRKDWRRCLKLHHKNFNYKNL